MYLQFMVDGDDFLRAGEASAAVKRTLKQLGLESSLIRRIAIAMYEAEMNMVLHANGGKIEVNLSDTYLSILLKDTGPGIVDVNLAMQEGYSTATQKIRELGFGAGMGLPNMKRYSDELKITTIVGVGTEILLGYQL
ncbi:MAG: anti-sigma regulatory factor [Cellulosilyticum sp.]|nr:anti-sigma regulatory factor [Cellulosilyticum sp.]